jgi:hypothetical protein
MHTLIDTYSDNYGNLNVPAGQNERFRMARSLLGYSLVHGLDYWLDLSLDKVDNELPEKPYAGDNNYSRKDRYLREAFTRLDGDSKNAVKKLLSETITGMLFNVLVNFDQFDFGELSIQMTTKSKEPVSIEMTSPTEDLYDELNEWIYVFSKHKDQLVEREVTSGGTSYRLK